MLRRLSGVRLHNMNRPLVFVLSLGLLGCVEEDVRPSPPELMSAPELSHPREPRMTDDPAPPMREDLKKTENSFITAAEPAPVHSSGTLLENKPAPHPATVDPPRNP
jgi:hypothetical protein